VIIYKDFSRLYTDGSRMGNQVAAVVVYRCTTKTARLTNTASIFSAELYAISLALAVICHSKDNNFVIFSDSMSSLQALSGFKLEIHFVQNIINDYTHLTNNGKTIILCWIPSHVSIVSSERADTAAKSALSLPITNMKLPEGELFPQFSKICLNEWQEIWTVVRVINSIIFTPQLALWHIAGICRATILYLSTDSALVIFH